MSKVLSILFIFIISCQPIEQNQEVVFDNSQLSKFEILANTIETKVIFEKKITEPYIGHTVQISPSQRVVNWLNDNFKTIGNQNRLEVDILDASLIEKKFQNKNATNFDNKINYKYELFYLIEFSLYDDYNKLIASTLVETRRSTTSGVYISLDEKEKIVNDLVYLSLVDLSFEAHKLLKKYMSNYIL